MLDPLEIIGAGLFAFVGAALIIGGMTLWTRRAASWRLPSPGEPTIFLFEGQDLVDATPAARRLLLALGPGDSDLARLLAFLARGFGVDLGRRLAGLPPGGRLSFPSPSGAGLLEVAEEGGALRLTLRPDDRGGSVVDRLSFDAAQEELLLLRGLAEDAPQPIWMLDGTGALTWANRAYLTLADQAGDLPGEPERAALIRTAWPATPLFERSADLRDGHVHQERLPLALPGWKEALWYDVTSIRRGSGSLHFAADVSRLLQAESARLHFVQTLAKTFAHLSTGLAIFDRDRRLVLFNPAFLDLTGLPSGFLSDRPLVQDLLDRLRDAKILPEPRDYASWRESVAALEAAAEQGQYCETWTLPGGQTYQVTGRPHPDGALAFLFEDISVEVGLTRRFRAELDSLRDVLDKLEEAVAVFSADGHLALSNAAYAALWPVPDGTSARPTCPPRWPLGGGLRTQAPLGLAARRTARRPPAPAAGPAPQRRAAPHPSPLHPAPRCDAGEVPGRSPGRPPGRTGPGRRHSLPHPRARARLTRRVARRGWRDGTRLRRFRPCCWPDPSTSPPKPRPRSWPAASRPGSRRATRCCSRGPWGPASPPSPAL